MTPPRGELPNVRLTCLIYRIFLCSVPNQRAKHVCGRAYKPRCKSNCERARSLGVLGSSETFAGRTHTGHILFRGQVVTPLTVFSPHAGPSGAYSPDGTMGYMMDGQQMMHRPPTDAFHNQYAHYPAEYYGHHL